MNEQPWQASTGPDVSLADDTVHVWLANLRLSAEDVLALRQALDAEELDRASRFRFAHLQQAYIVSHGILRRLLGCYLDREPASLRFQANPYGKPALVDHDLQFNLSHAGDYVLYALTKCHRVGIDIEQMKPLDDLAALARSVFSEAECTVLLGLPSEQQAQGFLNCWTRKEAYIKAIGKGLSQPLDAFDVTLVPGSASQLLRVADDPTAPDRWTLWDLPAPAGYAAACIVECPNCELELRLFTP